MSKRENVASTIFVKSIKGFFTQKKKANSSRPFGKDNDEVDPLESVKMTRYTIILLSNYLIIKLDYKKIRFILLNYPLIKIFKI